MPGTDLLNSLFTASILRQNKTVNNMTIIKRWRLVEPVGVAQPLSP